MSPSTRGAARPTRRPDPPPTTTSAPAVHHRPAALFPSVAEIVAIRGPYLVPLVLLIVARVAMWRLTQAPAEDAFITFRYARNLVSGGGLVYNPGERVMGFTSPLWTLWSALGIAAVRDPVTWSRVSCLAADIVTLLAGGALLARHASRFSAACFTFFFATWPYFAAVNVSGLEMSPLIALLVVSAGLVGSGSRATGAALGALALIRPEGVAAAAVLSIGARPRDRWIAAAIAAAAAGALTWWFGSPLPSSVASKARIYGTPGPWAGRIWWEWLSPAVLGRWATTSDGVPLAVLCVIAAPAFIVGIVALARAPRSPLALCAAAVLVIWLGYSLVGVTYFWWYFTVPLFGMALVASVGLPAIVRSRAIPAAIAVFVLSVWSVLWKLHVGRSGAEVNSFGAMADALAQRAAPGDTVMLEPIGMIGYTAPVVVIDETGLVTPEVARRRQRGEGWYTDIVRERRPDWIVIRLGALTSREGFAGVGQPFRSVAERDSALAPYRMVGQSGDKTDATTLALLQRVQ